MEFTGSSFTYTLKANNIDSAKEYFDSKNKYHSYDEKEINNWQPSKGYTKEEIVLQTNDNGKLKPSYIELCVSNSGKSSDNSASFLPCDGRPIPPISSIPLPGVSIINNIGINNPPTRSLKDIDTQISDLLKRATYYEINQDLFDRIFYEAEKICRTSQYKDLQKRDISNILFNVREWLIHNITADTPEDAGMCLRMIYTSYNKYADKYM